MEKFMLRFKSDKMQLMIAWQQFNENFKNIRVMNIKSFVTRTHKR